VPGNFFELSKTNFNISPLGTPACSTEAESIVYFIEGICANTAVCNNSNANRNILYMAMR
jgi:hypothetical protein